MNAQIAAAASRFSDRILQLLERVEYRIARTPAEREAVFRLRYDSYFRNGLIEHRDSGQLYDESYDDTPNSWITATFIDGELAGTTRVHVAFDEYGVLPSLNPFADLIAPHLRLGRVVTDLTRTAARLEFSRQFPELPYVTLRPAFMASEHFEADFAIATSRAEHAAFFRRVFRFVQWCEPRDYPNFTAKVVCLGLDFRGEQERTEARYPFFRSTPAEREALFGSLGDATSAGSHVLRNHGNCETRICA